MQSSERSDVALLVGLAIAALVTFQGAIYPFFEVGHEIEEEHGLALVPGLTVLITVLLGNRLIAKLRRAAEHRRAARADRALALNQALAQAATRDTIRDVLRQMLSAVTGSDRVWVAIRENGQWESVAGGPPGGPPRVSPDVEAIALKVVDRGADPGDEPLGQLVDGHLCFRIIVGDAVAALGVPHPGNRHDEDWRLRVATAATTIGMALRSAQLLADMEDHGALDGLTGCFNRTHGMQVLETELKRARRTRTILSIAMFDLDYFKSVNDEHGHLCGDELLTAVGRKLHEMLRSSDIKCRYGGEEFLIVLPDTPLEGAIHVGAMLRQGIEKLSIEWNGHTVSTTASIGVARAETEELDPKSLVGRADDALYRAKHAGRNRVCVYGADEQAVTEQAISGGRHGTPGEATPRPSAAETGETRQSATARS